MPTDRYLARVRKELADWLSENVLEGCKADYMDPEIFSLPVYCVYTTGQPLTQGLSFPIKFSFAVVDGADGKAYRVYWHPTHRRLNEKKLLGEFHDYRDPAGRYISHEWSLKAHNCSGTIVLPPWHVIQGIIASLRNPRPDFPVHLAIEENVKKGHLMGTAVIIQVNSNDLSQTLDTIAWIPRGYDVAWKCSRCQNIVEVTDWLTTYCEWRKHVGVCANCQGSLDRMRAVRRAALVVSGGTIAYQLSRLYQGEA